MSRLVDYAVRLVTAGLAVLALVVPYATVTDPAGGSFSGSLLGLAGAWRTAVTSPLSPVSVARPGILGLVSPETSIPLLGSWLAAVFFLVVGALAAVVAPRASRWFLLGSVGGAVGIVVLVDDAGLTVTPGAGLPVHLVAAGLALVAPRIRRWSRSVDRPTVERQGERVDGGEERDRERQ